MRKIPKRYLLNLKIQNENIDRVNPKKIVIAIDYGEKFSGISWTPDGLVVLPLLVCETEKLFFNIKKYSQEKKTKYILLGLPLSSDNSENRLCRIIRSFGKNLVQKGFKIEYVNERFSSQNTLSPDKKRIDDLASAQILEFWLRKKIISSKS